HGTSTFNSQYDGGGIHISNSSPTITDNVVQNNTACGDGAGIAIDIGAPTIQGNTIQNNKDVNCTGGDGGGIAMNSAGTPTIKNNMIAGNVATGVSPASSGGGMYMINGSDPLIVQ